MRVEKLVCIGLQCMNVKELPRAHKPHDGDFIGGAVVEQSVLDGGDASVHHVRWRHHVGAGFSIRQGHVGDSLTTQRSIDGSIFGQDAAVSVVRVRTQTHVDVKQQIGESLA